MVVGLSKSRYDEERGFIALGLNDIADVDGCINFRPATDADLDWMEIISDEIGGCRATVGFHGPGAGPHLCNLERGTFCTESKGGIQI